MKRKELLEKTQDENNKFDASSVVKKDVLVVGNLISQKELALLESEEAIAEYLSNPKLTINDEFLSLKRDERSIKEDIIILKQIKEDYL